MRKHRGQEDFNELVLECFENIFLLLNRIVATLETSETPTTLSITIQGEPMANFQLNAGDSVVVTVSDTDNVTGAVVTPDSGSVTAVLSSSADAISANSDGTYTITAPSTDVASVGNTVTVNATVNGVASTPGVGTYDVVPAVTPADATTLAVSFGTESPPVAVVPVPVASTPATNAPVTAGAVAGEINPATGLPFS